MIKKLAIKTIMPMLDTLDKIKNKKVPIKVGYQIARLISVLENEKKVYFETLRTLIEKYGVRDENNNLKVSEDGNTIAVIPELKEQCFSEMKELEDSIVDIDLPTFSIEDFNEVELTIEEIMTLTPLFND